MICIDIDELTHCLRNLKTGELIDTEIRALFSKEDLKCYTKRDWYVNWSKLLQSGHEIYGLYVKGDKAVQGLVALKAMPELKSVYIAWMVASPHNNREKTDNPVYSGVGGHLFALAIQRSLECGFGGHIYGYAKNEAAKDRFINNHGAVYIGVLHPFHIEISGIAARKIWREYNYDFFKEKT